MAQSLSESDPAVEGIAVGSEKDQLDTPALLVDLDRFERNAARLAGTLRAAGVDWRPHSKASKSPFLASLQVKAGAIGVTCAKVGEAEVMVEHGIKSVLIANEAGSRSKLDRVARLQERAEVIICADSEDHVDLASAAGVAAGVEIPLLVEIDVGMHRAGVASGAAALDLARSIQGRPGVRFAGLMGYEGHLQGVWPLAEKEAQVQEAMGRLTAARELLEEDGIPVSIVSGGGSGTHAISSRVAGMTEIQAGGVCFMDLFYADSCHLAERGFEFALTMLAMVTSRPAPDRAIIDTGFKALPARGATFPRPIGLEGVAVQGVSAEHGTLALAPDATDLHVGDRVELIPAYSDATTFLHDRFVGIRDGRVERVIPLLGRGRLG